MLTTAAAVGGATAATPAQASNYSGATNQVNCNNNMADGREHVFFYVSITDPMRAAMTWSRANNYDPTEINTVNETQGLSAVTDVVVYDEDYSGILCGQPWIETIGGSGMIGISQCQTANGAGRCESTHLKFDIDYMGPRSDAAEQALACHEVGHSVGLMHYTGGCMQDPAGISNALTDHDRVHLHNYLNL